MKNTLKKLGEAELEIMQVVWNSGNPIKDLSVVTVQREEICILRLFQKMNTRLERVNIFSKSCIIIQYRI